MTFKFWAAALITAAFAAVAMGGPQAEAAPKKKRIAAQYRPVPVSLRPSSRITVRARSFLDGGTEPLPGERVSRGTQQLYAVTMDKTPLSVIENTAFYHRDPLPGPFDLPDRRNPWPWNYCINC